MSSMMGIIRKSLLHSLLAFIVAGAGIESAPAQQKPAYRNPSLPIARRVNDLVSRMTLEEKQFLPSIETSYFIV